MVGIFIAFPIRNGHPTPESALRQRVPLPVDVYLIGNYAPAQTSINIVTSQHRTITGQHFGKASHI